MRRIHRWFAVAGVLCMLPFLLLYVAPLTITALYSLVQSPRDLTFVGFSHYRSVVENRFFQIAFGNTLRLLLYAVPPTVCAAILLAYCLERFRLPLLLALFVLPMFIPSAAVTLVFKQLFDPYQGLLLRCLPARSLSMLSLVAFFVWRYAGFFTLLITTGYRLLSPAAAEAALLDGASPLGAYLRVSLAQMRPQLLFAATLAVAYGLRMYREAYLLYSAYPDTSIYLLTHYQQNHFMKLQYANLSVAAILFLLPACALLWGFLRLDRRWREDAV